MRYLSLLAALYNPTKPNSIICIEGPELGLHPDILPNLAKLLKEASQDRQIIVTTHSDVLISALSDTPESVIVSENTKGFTTLRRLKIDDLKKWLEEDYSLGELWNGGKI